MKEDNSNRARWTVVLFTLTLVVGSLGLAGCPDDDDDDIFRAAEQSVSQQE
jgi:hypothetical protein